MCDVFTVDGITFDSIGIVDTFLAKYNSLGTTMVTGAKSGSDSDLVASFSLAIDGQDKVLRFSGYFSGSVNAA